MELEYARIKPHHGKIGILAEECESYSFDMIALTELHWIGQGKVIMVMKHGKWKIIIFSGTENNRREKTVGLMLSTRAARALLSFECISERLMIARFKCSHTKLTVVVCYASTNSETRPNYIADKDNFYNQLEDVTSSIPKHDVEYVWNPVMKGGSML